MNGFKIGKVNTKSLYVRTGPGADYTTIEEMPIIMENTSVDILKEEKDEENNLWYGVIIDDKVSGYVKADYIDIK